MIEVRGVKLTAHDQRTLRGGWGTIHWVACLPMYVPYVAFLAMGLTVSVMVGDLLPPFLLPGFIIGTGLVWWAATIVTWKVVRAEGARAPAGALASDWTLDDAGMTLTNPLVGSRVAWAGMRGVREEKDRFVFLVAPMNNPVLPHRCLQPEQLKALRALLETVRTSGRLGAGVD
ncbi:MAG: YcxB family protein [Brevundimonas sp.]|uniref:YcxB family protein n=1 Tax=Brevundimonas sp. TaxID=1871086 RepID=UPI0012141F2A|nr:YcxB family protein [Brevundimonas sp.]RZJ16943.1 MAG: YcxB family protein [Brevundimonas sp.]